jgi:NAD(P)-dependent dehydrogenase (short-subunit alcohol dehydrogenase family)
VGGTGGLGKATLRLLVDLGAKRLVTLSRSGPDTQSMQEVVEELSLKDVKVTVYKGSVLDKSTIQTIKEECKEHPIKGIIQGAMVLQDSRVENMTYEQWRTAVDPKVRGTWNLHEVFGSSLDFFVLLSSCAGIIGSIGQGNYCAGNTFQDAFARYRAGLGLAGRSINVGVVEGEGYTAENEAAAEFIRRQGGSSYRLTEYLATVEDAIANPVAATCSEAQLLCGISAAEPSSTQTATDTALQRPDPKFSHIWRKAAHQEQKVSTSGQIDAQTMLRNCTTANEAAEMTLQALKAKLARLLAVPVEEIRTDRSIASHGMDSLIAVEVRNWISTVLEANVQMFELMSSMPFSELALVVAKRSRLIAPSVFAETA